MTRSTTPPDVDEVEVSEEDVERRILHILTVYPVISPTMLQSGLGPYMKPRVWRPVLQALIANGQVVEGQDSRQTPIGRYNSYAKLYLPGNEKLYHASCVVKD